MCGIFGLLGREVVSAEQFARLGDLNTVRGNLAFGGLIWREQAVETFHFLGPFDPTKLNLTGATAVLGHIRAPTGGKTKDIRQVHPFSTAVGWLAHNGILLNHFQFPAWQLSTDIPVDSTYILGGIQANLSQSANLSVAIQTTAGKLEGQQGCWLWSRQNPSVYLWRVMSSLYYLHQPGQLIFSSVAWNDAAQLLPEGQVYQADPSAQDFKAVGTFSFYNPYKI